MTRARLAPALLALGCAVALHASAPSPDPATEWHTWLVRDAGASDAAASCVADQAPEQLPRDVLATAPVVGFDGIDDAWRPRVAQIFVACVIEAG